MRLPCKILKEDLETLLDLTGTGGELYSHVIDVFITTFVALFSDSTALGSMDMYIPCYMLANKCAYLKDWNYFENLKMAGTISWVAVTKGHYAYVHLITSRREIIIFETMNLIFPKDIDEIISVLASKVDESISGYKITRLSTAIVPPQLDGKSCGVLACLHAMHMHHKLALPIMTKDLYLKWREYIAFKVCGAA